MRSKIAVIGAGPAGLAAAKELRAAGQEVLLFEAGAQLGGRWAHTPESYCYESLRANVSRDMSAFSDFPPPSSFPQYPSRDQLLSYFLDYAEQNGLTSCARLGVRLEEAEPVHPGRTWTPWSIRLREAKSGAETRLEVDALVLATGALATPRWPVVDREAYRGALIHAAAYREPSLAPGKRVLVVGGAASALEIAGEIAGLAEETHLAIRRPVHLLPHYQEDGLPSDYALSKATSALPRPLLNRILRHLLGRRNRPLYERGLPVPGASGGDAPPAKSPLFEAAVLRGQIRFRPALAGLDPQGARFVDGSRGDFDLILCATGYALSLPFLRPRLLPRVGAAGGPRLELYRELLSPSHGSLAFVGHLRVEGSLFPVVEMQARWLAALWSGALARPSRGSMWAAARARPRMGEDVINRVPFVRYLDALAGEIGCRPRILARLRTDPELARRLWAGPAFPYRYRLDGPGRWEGAREALFRQQPRSAHTGLGEA